MSSIAARTSAPLFAAAAFLLLTAATPVRAQEGQAEKPATAGDTELVGRPETEDEKKQRLIEQYRKLKGEVDFLTKIESGGGLVGKLKVRLSHRTVESQVEAIDDPGTPQGAPPVPAPAAGDEAQPQQPPQVKKARLLGDAEKAALPEGTILAVDGKPVLESEFQEVFDYLRSVPSGRSEDELKTQALETVIVRKAVESAFPDGAKRARDRMVQIQQQLAGGTDFADVARAQSDCPSKAQGGDLGWFGRVGMDTHFTIAAFSLKDGEVSKPIQTSFGYHILKRTGSKKGADALGDQVHCSHILAMYDNDQFKVRQASVEVRQGKVDVAFASDDYRKLAPAFLR